MNSEEQKTTQHPYSMFLTDTDMETKGIVLNYGRFQITIKRAGGKNTAFLHTLNRYMRPHQRQARLGTIDEDLSASILAKVYAETVIVKWEPFFDLEGNPAQFTKDNVVKVLTGIPDLFTDIRNQSIDSGNFHSGELDEAAKNS